MKSMDNKIRIRVIRSANATCFVYAVSAVTLPICLVKMKQELGLSLTQAGSLGFITSLEQLVFLLLSGIIAAKYGKIRVLKSALLILSVGLLLFTQVSTYLIALGIILVIGIGNAFLEALLIPLVEDLYPDDNGGKLNLLTAYWPVGVICATLTTGELLSRGISWRWIFAGVAMLVLIVFLFYPRTKHVRLPKRTAEFQHIREIFSQPKFYVMAFALFYAGAAEGALTFWLASYIQLDMGGLPRAGGIGTASFALGMFLGRLGTSQLTKKYNLKRIIQISTFLSILASTLFFFANQILLLYFIVFLAGVTIACLWPSIQIYAVRVIPLDATLIMILLSCFGLVGFSSASLLMGIIGDVAGLKTSFIVVPVCQTFLLLLMFIESKILFIRIAK
jgi:fucose permease